MTLIVAIKCRNGIVLGADGAATLGSLGQYTVRQPVKKLTIIDGCVVVGVSGFVGLGQRITGAIEDLWKAKKLSPKGQQISAHHATPVLSTAIRQHVLPEIQVAQTSRPLVGDIAAQSVLTSTIVAVPVSQRICLFEFDFQGAGEEKTDDLPFVSIGSGQKSADPFLAFLRRTLWKDTLPSVADGIFAAYWTLHYAIKGDPGGVADPKQVVVIEKNKSWKARELEESELRDHSENVDAMEKMISDYPARFQEEGEDDQQVPVPGDE